MRADKAIFIIFISFISEPGEDYGNFQDTYTYSAPLIIHYTYYIILAILLLLPHAPSRNGSRLISSLRLQTFAFLRAQISRIPFLPHIHSRSRFETALPPPPPLSLSLW